MTTYSKLNPTMIGKIVQISVTMEVPKTGLNLAQGRAKLLPPSDQTETRTMEAAGVLRHYNTNPEGTLKAVLDGPVELPLTVTILKEATVEVEVF